MRFQKGYLGHVFVIAWTSAALVAIWHVYVGATDSSLALGAGALLLASLAMSRYLLGLSLTSAPMVYLGLMGLFHLGIVVPWALGIYDISRMPWFVPFGLSRALALITYSIVTYQLGVLVALKGHRCNETAIVPDGYAGLEDATVFGAGSLAFLVGATMFVIGLIRLDPIDFYRLTYSETWRLRAESDPRFFGTGITVALIGLCLAVAGASRRQMRVTYLYAGLWFSTLFYLGFRSPAITGALLVYAASYKKGIRCPRWALGTAGSLLLVAVPIMTAIREQPLDDRSIGASLHDMNILDGPAEVGESIWPLVETVDLVGPGNYRKGTTYLVDMKGILPNLALHWAAPATGSIDDLPPSHWITAIVAPWSYRNYQGIGFSAIAEPYINFGTIGVVCYFFLLACLLIRLEQASVRSSYGLATWALILGPLLWTARNDFTQFFRPAAWGLLYLGVIRLSSGGYSLISSARQRRSFEIEPNIPQEERV